MKAVAPFMGAWIEIMSINAIGFRKIVAPFMSAWIEIPAVRPYFPLFGFAPLRVRGLKYDIIKL